MVLNKLSITESGIEKEPWLAAIFSMLIPGAGQFYGYSKGKGIIIFTIIETMVFSGLWSIISYEGDTLLGYYLLCLTLIVTVWNIYDAVLSTRRKNIESFEVYRRQTKDPFLAMFLSFLIPGLGHLYSRKYFVGTIVFIIFLILLFIEIDFYFQIALYLFWGMVAYHAYKVSLHRNITFKWVVLIVLFEVLMNVFFEFSIYYCDNYYYTYSYSIGDSSLPTISPGDITLESIIDRRQFERGDFVSIRGGPITGNKILGKRVIAFGNEEVEIRGGGVYINGKRIETEPIKSIKYTTDSNFAFALPGQPYKVPNGFVFVLGDNSKESTDSRQIGPFEINNIVSVTYKIIWPISRIRTL